MVLDAGPRELADRDDVDVVIARRRGRDAADDEIVEWLRANDEPVTVVTSDAPLADRVRALGAGVEGARRSGTGSGERAHDRRARPRGPGMTVRNVRAHQSRGLLPPPEVRGRTGYYGPEHVARIELIRELQADGFNLDLIRQLLDERRLERRRAALHPRPARALRRRAAAVITVAELAERWGSTDPTLRSAPWRSG